MRDLAARAPVTLPGDTEARDAARLMSKRGIGSVVVTGEGGAPVGIVTDRDLRGRLVAESRDPSVPLREIMSAPLATVGPEALAFEALLEMTRLNVHHLAVVEGGRLVSVLSSNDFLFLQGTHPVALSREIERQASLSDLKKLVPGITRLAGVLARARAAPFDIGRIIAELNDRVVQRVLGLTEVDLGRAGQRRPPLVYAWLALGSEGRREQTLLTDQDNALVYADPEDPEAAAAASAYFQALARAASAALVQLGFPPCPGGWMASNPRWCQPLAVWLGYFDRWIRFADVSVLSASICFDLRAVAGDPTLAGALWGRILEPSGERRLFLTYLARDVLRQGPSLGILGRFRTDAHGLVDLKRYGAFPLVGAARVHALELGLPATNTVERVREVGARGVLGPERVAEVTQAYSFVLELRLHHQLQQLDEGRTPDNRIDPRQLSRTDRLLLKEAFRTVGWVEREVRDRYQADMIP